jgi:hypothetical protein
MSIQRIRSKKAKTDVLLASEELAAYIPETLEFSRAKVKQLLDKYRMIYVKPVNGTFGSGVIRVELRESPDEPYFFQSGERRYAFATFDEMFEKLLAVKKPKSYLAQQGIHLLKYRNRRFDLRIMVQQNPQGRWESTGMIGRLAHPRKIVTNYHSGGTPMPVDKLLAPPANAEDIRSQQTKLRSLGVKVASALQKKYPRIKEIGIDVAIDDNWDIWILEVNTLPDPFLFKKLPEREVFRKIYRYAVGYGRFPTQKRRR